ncbi:MAG: hypothetical protein ACRCW2_16300 [Cellulosilyticaceae bacterium]
MLLLETVTEEKRIAEEVLAIDVAVGTQVDIEKLDRMNNVVNLIVT